MEAHAANFLEFIEGRKQFGIPIYQRAYSWNTKQCLQLWNDIVKASQENSKGHFIGSIVYIQPGLYKSTSMTEMHVIDGQQRLVTLSLLLKAVAKALEKSQPDGNINSTQIHNYYLLNSNEKDGNRRKLLLNGTDKDTLFSLIDEIEPPKLYSNQIVKNYKFFEERINSNSINLNKLYEGINKLFIVDVALERGKDNPQLIFESLNSTGLDLSQADLIRNYVLMGLEPEEQKRIYEKYWYPMENDFTREEYTEYFDKFIRDYLTIRLERIPDTDEVYLEFRSFVSSYEKDIEAIVADIRYYSKIFVKLALVRETDEDIRLAIQDLKDLKVQVSFPFLMEVFHDYNNGIIDRDVLIAIIRMIESYVFRRAICGIPPASLNKTFATLAKKIDKRQYLESLAVAFLLMKIYKRFPTDEEFKIQFVSTPLYNLRVRGYALEKLENYGHPKEVIESDDYTIEHIMPQSSPLPENWRKELGEGWEEIHEKYLHTIGNLTLTGYNSELSNLSFLEKRDREGGFSSSPIWLNSDLAKFSRWNENEINLRAKRLTEYALNIWKRPEVSNAVLNKYAIEETDESPVYSEEDHLEKTSDLIRSVYDSLKEKILSFSSEITVAPKKKYIAFVHDRNFAAFVFYRNQLNIYLNLRKGTLQDLQNIAEDVSEAGHWGTGHYRITMRDFTDIDHVLPLIKQSFEKQLINR